MSLIICRYCNENNCEGCNMFTLAKALTEGAFEYDEHKNVIVPTAKQKLLPCPFCGSKFAEIQYKPKNHSTFPYRVRCTTCFAKLDWYKSEKVAVEAWNKRGGVK